MSDITTHDLDSTEAREYIDTRGTNIGTLINEIADLLPVPTELPLHITEDDIERGLALYALPSIVNGAQAWTVERVDLTKERARLESLQEGPPRINQTVELEDVTSFNTYVSKYVQRGTKVYASSATSTIVAVIDDHCASPDSPYPDQKHVITPQWRQHRAKLTLLKTPAFELWSSINGKLFTQTDFCDKIEDGLGSITSPDGTDLFEMLQGFRVTAKAEYHARVNVQSGKATFSYTSEETTKVGKGEVSAPYRITLLTALYRGSDPVTFTARLRWRVSETGLQLGIVIDNLAELQLAAFRAEVDKVEADCILNGTP